MHVGRSCANAEIASAEDILSMVIKYISLLNYLNRRVTLEKGTDSQTEIRYSMFTVI